jgi:hypothetical protein
MSILSHYTGHIVPGGDMMQVKIGNRGSNPVGVRFGGGGVRGAVRDVAQSMSIPENWIYIACIVVLLAIVMVLIVLILWEYNLQKKKKK